MELRQLRYFVAVADAQSITAAARDIHVVQSALSHQIARLEHELQSELFLRGKNGVRLTDAGQVLYRHAMAVTKHVEAARHGIREVGQEVHGKVAFGIPNSTAAILALPLLQAVRAELPHIEFTLAEGLSGALSDQLAKGRIDMAILFEPEARRGFECVPLVNERLHFVSADPEMRRTYAGCAQIAFEQVTHRPLILPPKPNGIRMLLEREVLRANLGLRVVADITGVQTMLAAVQAGVADSVMMAANAQVHGKQPLLVLPIADPEIDRPAGLFQPRNFTLTAAANGVRDIALRLTADMLASGRWTGARRAEKV